MMATDLTDRADRVRAVVEGNHGKVIDCTDDVMTVEIPADIAPGMAAIWGLGGFVPAFTGQTARLAPRRVLDMNSNTIVCDGDLVTTAFYIFDINLQPRVVTIASTCAPPITAPTPPFAG
jgi:hypothetical protein